MKKIIRSCAAMLLIAMAVTACHKETTEHHSEQADGQQSITLCFKNSKSSTTRTFGTGATETWEKAVNMATLFVFDTDGVLKYHRDLSASEIAEATTKPISIIVPNVYEGKEYDFIIVANRTVPKSVTSMDRLLSELDEDAAAYNGSFEKVSTGSIRPEGFAMSGRTRQRIENGRTSVSIELIRTVAKIEVQMSITEAFKEKYGEQAITIDRIRLSRGSGKTYLIDQHDTDHIGNIQNFETEQESVEGHNLFYIFENAGGIERKRTLLTIEATYDIDGLSTTTDDRIPVVYEVELTGEGEGRILRNGAYYVNASINGLTGSDIIIKIDVANWETLANQNIDMGR